MPSLRDVICPRPRLLLVGINPSLRSGEVGHYFAGPGNPFWRLIHAAGLAPEPLMANTDQRLAEFGIALTNVCARPTRSAAELKPEEIERGARTAAATKRFLRGLTDPLCRKAEKPLIRFVGKRKSR